VAALGAWRWLGRGSAALPATLTTEEVVADLSAAFDPSAVERQAPDAPVRRGDIEPGDPLRGDGIRASLVAPAPSRLRFALDVPADAALRFAAGVEGTKKREEGRSAVRFAVAVDGRQVFSRTVDPSVSRHDRRWFDERVDLGAFAGRRVELALETSVERADRPAAGLPGWSHVRVVRATSRPRQRATPQAPNLLVLLVDTLRADRLGCYGASPSPSPTLDRLAATGLVFEHAFAQASWTMPSVATLLTGLYPRSHGAFGDPRRAAMPDDDPGSGEFLADPLLTWAEAASATGVTTVGWSANPLVSRATNMAQGFETFGDMPWDPDGRNWTPAAEVNARFLGWLRANRGWRFVAYLHYMEPHDPYTPPPAVRPPPPPGVRPALAAGWIRDVANDINWGGAAPLPAAELDYVRRLYDGEIHGWDESLSALLDALSTLGLRDSTVVIVTADHGEEFQEHGHLAHGSHLYQETIHVPLVVAGPGIPAERRADVAQGVDLFPTVAHVVGFPVPVALPGRDLIATRTEDGPVFSETGRGIGPDGVPVQIVSVVADGWKLIRTPAVGRTELYDLTHDPAEHDDRAGAGEGDELSILLTHWQESTPLAPVAAGHDGAMHEKLRALGYVQ
jgi:arylsulfatase A-like enzyme